MLFQDERLARFVTGSHMKHHPNATDNDMDENLVSYLGSYYLKFPFLPGFIFVHGFEPVSTLYRSYLGRWST